MSFASQSRADQNRAAMHNVNPPGYRPRPPGDVTPPDAAVPVQQVGTPPPSNVTTDGRVPGIDGMLNQVAEALVKQVSADEKLQERVGAAAGRALGIVVLEGLFVGWVVKQWWKSLPVR